MLQSFLCRLTLFSLPLSLLWPVVGSKRIGIREGHFRQGVSAPSNLELVREGYLLQFDWLFFFPLLPCLFLNRVRKTGFLRPLLQLECAWMLSQSCRRLLRRGLQGTRGVIHDPSPYLRVEVISAYSPGQRGISTSRTGPIFADMKESETMLLRIVYFMNRSSKLTENVTERSLM